MKTIENLLNQRKGEEALIICAGSTIRDYKERIDNFIERINPFTIGINNINEYFTPQYHLWTNTKRFRNFGRNMTQVETILLGSGIHLKTIKEVIGNRNYYLINFTDMKEGIPLGYKNGKIYGFFRTAGNLAIMIAHLMGARAVNIVGMDGHTFHPYRDVVSGKAAHHCYDEKYEPYSKEICVKKDEITSGVLSDLKAYGINLRILTPTVYKPFYAGGLL